MTDGAPKSNASQDGPKEESHLSETATIKASSSEEPIHKPTSLHEELPALGFSLPGDRHEVELFSEVLGVADTNPRLILPDSVLDEIPNLPDFNSDFGMSTRDLVEAVTAGPVYSEGNGHCSASIDPLEHTRELPVLNAEELWFLHDTPPEPLNPGSELKLGDTTMQILSCLQTHTYERRYRVAVEGHSNTLLLKQGANGAAFIRYDFEHKMLTTIHEGEVSCPGLPKSHGHWRDEKHQYLLSEVTPGCALSHLIESEEWTLRDHVNVLMQLLDILKTIHKAGFVLTSLRPTSIFVSSGAKGQQVSIDDFNNAVEILSRPPYSLASPFTSPEVSERSTVDEDVDFFSIGALLYKAVTGYDFATYGLGKIFRAEEPETRLPLIHQILSRTLSTPSEHFFEIDDLILAFQQFERELQPQLHYQVSTWTSTGLNPMRIMNQDSAGYLEFKSLHRTEIRHRGFYCVADGMGGHAEGDRASELAVQGSIDKFQSLNNELDHKTWQNTSAEVCKQLAVAGSERLVETIASEGLVKKMGTTFTSVLIVDDILTMAHVGDSRAFQHRGDEVVILSEDHSLVNMMVKAGRMTPEQAEVSGEKNILVRSMGAERVMRSSMFDGLDVLLGKATLKIEAGDRFILVSDGVWGMIPRADMKELVLANQGCVNLCQVLCQEALERGGHDNVAALVIEAIASKSPFDILKITL